MKGKLLFIAALTATALNAYAEGKILKHTEQAAPHTKLTLTTLKTDPSAILKLMKLHASQHISVQPEHLITATSKLETIEPISWAPKQTMVKGTTSYMIWNMSQTDHFYKIGRNVCISDQADITAIRNCSYINDEVYVKANDVGYLNSEIQANQELTAGTQYYVTVGISVQDESSTELFMSDDGRSYAYGQVVPIDPPATK